MPCFRAPPLVSSACVAGGPAGCSSLPARGFLRQPFEPGQQLRQATTTVRRRRQVRRARGGGRQNVRGATPFVYFIPHDQGGCRRGRVRAANFALPIDAPRDRPTPQRARTQTLLRDAAWSADVRTRAAATARPPRAFRRETPSLRLLLRALRDALGAVPGRHQAAWRTGDAARGGQLPTADRLCAHTQRQGRAGRPLRRRPLGARSAPARRPLGARSASAAAGTGTGAARRQHALTALGSRSSVAHTQAVF
jgi:hypothetical protein